MEANATRHFRFLIAESNKGYVGHAGFTHEQDYDRWLNAVAGTGLYEKTGWGWEGWKLWWNDYKLYKMIMDGPDTPFSMRLFVTDRGRKHWPGARAAMEKANRGMCDFLP